MFSPRDSLSLPNLTPLPVSDLNQHVAGAECSRAAGHSSGAVVDTRLEEAVSWILTDCFFSLGQGASDHQTIEHAAIMWLHDRYRAKFLRAMNKYSNRWLRDRHRVKAVSRMLGERAAYYAAEKPSIDLAAVMQASADVERYCEIHSRRNCRQMDDPTMGQKPRRRAGRWCEADDPENPDQPD